MGGLGEYREVESILLPFDKLEGCLIRGEMESN